MLVDDDIELQTLKFDEVDEVEEEALEVVRLLDDVMSHFNEVRDEAHDVLDDDEVDELEAQE